MAIVNTNCIYKSVTLVPGEVFVIPPGGELVGATDVNALTSSCDEELNVENLQCYCFVIGSGNDDDSASDQFMEGDRIKVLAYLSNGQETIFPTEIQNDGNGTFSTNLTLLVSYFSNIPGIIDVTPGILSQGDMCFNYFVFKSIPSIVSNLEIKLYTYAPSEDQPPTNHQFLYIKPRLLSEMIDEGYENLPNCTI